MKSPSGILSWQKITIFLSRIFTKNFYRVLPEYPEPHIKIILLLTFHKRKKNAQSAKKEKTLKITNNEQLYCIQDSACNLDAKMRTNAKSYILASEMEEKDSEFSQHKEHRRENAINNFNCIDWWLSEKFFAPTSPQV